MKVKIVGDGTAEGTKVFNAETGEVIEGINYIVYEQDPHGPARLMLGMVPETVDLSVDNVDLLDSQSLAPTSLVPVELVKEV